MARRTEHFGHRAKGTGKSDRFLSPQVPQTGDGRTTREPHDRPRVTAFAAIFGLKPKPKD